MVAERQAQQQTTKRVQGGADALAGIAGGVNLLAKLTRLTYGPRRSHVLMERKMDSPILLSHPGAICKGFEVVDPLTNLGVRMLQEAQSGLRQTSGAGLSTTAILLDEMCRAGVRLVRAGVDPHAMRRGMELMVARAVEELEGLTVQVDPARVIGARLRSEAYGSDFAELVGKAVMMAGADGGIRVQQSRRINCTLVAHEGVLIERGLVSAALAGDTFHGTSHLDRPYIFVTRRTLSSRDDVLALLERVRGAGGSLLLIAPSIEGDALSMLVSNHLRGRLSVAAIQAPDYGEQRDESLVDLAALTGGLLDSDSVPAAFALECLGRAEEAVVGRSHTVIRRPHADETLVNVRISQIEAQIDERLSQYERERLQNRLGRLRRRSVTLEIGGINDAESGELVERTEEMLRSLQAGFRGGLVPGAGSALARAAAASVFPPSDDEGVRAGVELVRSALLGPARQILHNAGVEWATAHAVIERYRAGDANTLFNVLDGQWVTPEASGVADPLEVIVGALRTAASLALTLLSAGTVITAEISR